MALTQVPREMTAFSQSMVRVNTGNGYGSTNTMIRRFTNTVTNVGSDITYADSATLGASFTINNAGVYSISYSDAFTSNSFMGISLNTTQPTTNITSINVGNALAVAWTTATAPECVSWTGYLDAGSVIRAHANANTQQAGVNGGLFTITRIA